MVTCYSSQYTRDRSALWRKQEGRCVFSKGCHFCVCVLLICVFFGDFTSLSKRTFTGSKSLNLGEWIWGNSFFFRKEFFRFLLAVLGLRCCAWAFSSCGEWGLLFVGMHGFLIAATSLIAEHGLGTRASVVLVHGLSCSRSCGIFPDQGSNPCPLHWQADS